MVGVFQVGDGGVAHLAQIEAADLGRHAHSDALIGGHQHVGEGGGQQGRLLHGVVIVVHKVHGVAVQIAEQLGADGGELGLGIAAGGVGHVAGVDLAEVALAVHKGVQQGLVALGQTHHGLIDGLIAVGVQTHGLAHDVGGLGAAAGEKPHLVHGVQELTVSGLEAVDLRNGTGDDNAHGVGHIVFVQRSGDGLIHHRAPQTHYIGVGRAVDGTVGGCFFCHRKQVPFLFTGMKSDDFIAKRDGGCFWCVGADAHIGPPFTAGIIIYRAGRCGHRPLRNVRSKHTPKGDGSCVKTRRSGAGVQDGSFKI